MTKEFKTNYNISDVLQIIQYLCEPYSCEPYNIRFNNHYQNISHTNIVSIKPHTVKDIK